VTGVQTTITVDHSRQGDGVTDVSVIVILTTVYRAAVTSRRVNVSSVSTTLRAIIVRGARQDSLVTLRDRIAKVSNLELYELKLTPNEMKEIFIYNY